MLFVMKLLFWFYVLFINENRWMNEVFIYELLYNDWKLFVVVCCFRYCCWDIGYGYVDVCGEFGNGKENGRECVFL